jgi:putative nucleotidyltransferase with HDIG domain
MAVTTLLTSVPDDRALQGAVAPSLPNDAVRTLERAFGRSFSLIDGATGEVLIEAADAPRRDWALRTEVCREVARRGQPEFIDEEDPFITLAIPTSTREGVPPVAVATFVTRGMRPGENVSHACAMLGMDPLAGTSWAVDQAPWPPDALLRLAELALMDCASRSRIRDLEHETRSLSVNLASTYEEISLLYRLTQNLRISESDEDLGRIALEWLAEVIPAQALVMQLLPLAPGDASLRHTARSQSVLLTYGDCPIDESQFDALMAHLAPGQGHRPIVMNRAVTGREGWPCAAVRQMVVVSLVEGEHTFGWLAAINHADDAEFGTVEASLLNSVGAILGIHSGNLELYRQQSELLAGIVRALTSAIDAKDQYTCGHSDRVARLAVRLAEELGCDARVLNTIYLAGLLHDIGKIGIDDQVLRKPDKLTAAEYEHIKRHVVIGHKILRDLGKLEDVLPVVLHHHESWDGGGYPNRLVKQDIPLAARIVAVADSYDAMGSDRPYRKGLPDDKIEKILRSGAGQQWDPDVVEAFFRARDDLRTICNSEQEQVEIDFQQWK